MSTDGYSLYKAIVHSISDGVVNIKIPSMLSNTVVPVDSDVLSLDGNGAPITPAVGSSIMVAISPDLSHYSWVTGVRGSTAIHVGPTPPSDTTLLWVDTS